MRLSGFGKLVIVLGVGAIVLTAFSPVAGIAVAVVVALLLLGALAEGMSGGSDGGQGHEAWARTDTDRKREALRRERR